MQTQPRHNRDLRVARLVPREPSGPDIRAMSPFALFEANCDEGDLICAGLEEMSRHLRHLDDDFRLCHFERLEARARSIVMLADQLGLRQIGQVASDVTFCLESTDEIALAATLSRLMRLMTQALDHAAGPMASF